jgi:hypothetical protein
MKIIVRILAVIGVIALLFTSLRWVVLTIAPSYEETSAKQFGRPEAISAITQLYLRVEKSPSTTFQIVDTEGRQMGFPKVVKIPRNLIPPMFEYWGINPTGKYLFWGDVLAYYDKDDGLVGIMFYGSRYGCFVSRSPTVCPPWFTTLQHLSGPPLYIRSWVTGDPE